MTIWAIQKPNKEGEEYIPKIFESLKGGEGRFGWSYDPSADMRELKKKVNSGTELNVEERKLYHPFLLEIQAGDWVVYINQPEWGLCTLAKVTGPYKWRWEGGDFNHRFPVDERSVRTFDRNDKIVHPHLRRRLKLQPRKWKIHDAKEEFQSLLSKLKNAGEEGPRNLEDNLSFLLDEIDEPLKQVANKIQRTHPAFDLEGLIEATLNRVPGVEGVEWHRGRADQGADLTAEVEVIPGLLQTVVIQVKSYVGEIDNLSAVEDIERTLDNPDIGADMGLIVSTATTASKRFMDALDKLREEKGKPVALLLGAELAHFVLKHRL